MAKSAKTAKSKTTTTKKRAKVKDLSAKKSKNVKGGAIICRTGRF